MRPPPLLLLQGCNALANLSTFIAINATLSLWNAAGWRGWQSGIALSAANLAYALTAAQGGRVADRFGRTVACLSGALVCMIGCAICALWPAPGPALVGLVLAVAGTAIYFPGSAGLFSDAEGARGGVAAPLHAKVNRYNLGWSTGIFVGFLCGVFLAGLPYAWMFVAALIANAALFAILLPWHGLPPQPPPPQGDRTGHPALKRLTFMARIAALLGCCVGMGMMAQLESTLSHAVRDPGALRRTASLVMSAYPVGYIATFTLLGRWGGWVLRPWRLWALQSGLLVGSLGFVALSYAGVLSTPALMLCATLVGSGFGAVYLGSIYYSLRLPDGAARAAGLHETCIGAGNTVGPLLAGVFLSAWVVEGGGVSTRPLLGLGVFMVVAAAMTLAWQAALIPRAMRAR